MGLFSKLKKEATYELLAVSPVKGKTIPIEEAKDEVFSQKLMGDGIAIEPSDGNFYAPISGVIVTAFPTGHAFGIKREDGLEILLHIGIDTVSLNGEHFQTLVKQDQKIKQGEPLVKVDLESVAKAGFDTTTMMISTAPEYSVIEKKVNEGVSKDTTILRFQK